MCFHTCKITCTRLRLIAWPSQHGSFILGGMGLIMYEEMSYRGSDERGVFNESKHSKGTFS